MRFETPGSGFLFKHDYSLLRQVPGLGGHQYLILKKDDYSRLFVSTLLLRKEMSYGHLQIIRRDIERYGRVQTYYMDQHKSFRSEHRSIHAECNPGQDEIDSQFKSTLQILSIGLIHNDPCFPIAKG